MNIKKIILLTLLLATNISFGKVSTYNYIKKFSEFFTPLPIEYSEQSKKEAGYDEIMNILLGKKRNGNGLLKSEDALLIMTWDGDYTIFKYSGPDDFTVFPVSRKMLIDTFNNLKMITVEINTINSIFLYKNSFVTTVGFFLVFAERLSKAPK